MHVIKLIQVCSDKPYFVAEAKLGGAPNLSSIYELMRNSRFFETVTHLANVGILRARHRDKSVIIFKDGRITINCVRDVKEASEFLQFLLQVSRLR